VEEGAGGEEDEGGEEELKPARPSGVGWGEPQANPNTARRMKVANVGVRLRLTPTYAAVSGAPNNRRSVRNTTRTPRTIFGNNHSINSTNSASTTSSASGCCHIR